MTTRRRSFLEAYLVEPFKQIKFGLHVVAWCLVYSLLLGGIVFHAFFEQYKQLVELFNVAQAMDVLDNRVFIKNFSLVIIVLLLFLGTIFWVVLRRTHKMYGPMISIVRFVDDLKRGNYNAQLRIRKTDDFQQLAEKLNELATVLQQRHGCAACDSPQTVSSGENHPLVKESDIPFDKAS